eukprot:gene9570-6725_t
MLRVGCVCLEAAKKGNMQHALHIYATGLLTATPATASTSPSSLVSLPLYPTYTSNAASDSLFGTYIPISVCVSSSSPGRNRSIGAERPSLFAGLLWCLCNISS